MITYLPTTRDLRGRQSGTVYGTWTVHCKRSVSSRSTLNGGLFAIQDSAYG